MAKKTYLFVAPEDCATQTLVGGEVTGETEDSESKTQEENGEDMNNENWRQENAKDEDEIDERDDGKKHASKSAGRVSEYEKMRQRNIAENQILLAAVKEQYTIEKPMQKPAAKKRAVKEKRNDKPVERCKSLRNKNL